MKRTCLLLVFICLSSLWAQTRDHNSYPRLANYYLNHIYPAQNATMIPQLARYDLLVLDMELGAINPALITGIRAVNPSIVILAYITVGAITSEPNPSPASYPLRRALRQSIQNDWWLMTSTGEHASDWPGTWMLNCTLYCPVVNGKTWTDHLHEFINQSVLSNPVWDGVFLDNCYHSIPSDSCPDTDCDRNGIIDGYSWRDQQWQAGLRPFIAEVKASNPTKPVVGNPGYIYGESLNGGMFEEYDTFDPGFGFGMTWSELMGTYYDLQTSFQNPRYNMVQAAGASNSYQQMRYTLTTALLGDAYYGFDFGPTNHGQLWWYDEFDVDLGEPLEEYLELGSEQITNGNFSNGTNGWELEVHWPASANLSINSGSGNPYAVVNITTPHPNPTDANFYEIALKQLNNSNLSFLPDQLYKISFRAKASFARQMYMIILRDVGPNYPWLISNQTIDLDTSWQEYEFIVSPNTSIAYPASEIRFTFHLAQAGGMVSFDDISMRPLYGGFPAMREFENGLVICNPGTSPITVNLPETYYRIAGAQDPVVNSGNSCTQITVPAKDGRILLKSRPRISLMSPDQLTFASQWVGTTSAAQAVTIKNSGTSPLILSGIAFGTPVPGFSYSGISFPIELAINQSISFSVIFSPQSDGQVMDTLYILNNSVNNNSLPVNLLGTAQYPQPQEPQNVTITIQGANAVITWDPVTQSILNTPFSPDYYLVFYNGSTTSDGEYYFHGITTATAYTHQQVANHAQHMFYRVHAYKATSRMALDKVLALEAGVPESEVFRILSKN